MPLLVFQGLSYLRVVFRSSVELLSQMLVSRHEAFLQIRSLALSPKILRLLVDAEAAARPVAGDENAQNRFLIVPIATKRRYERYELFNFFVRHFLC